MHDTDARAVSVVVPVFNPGPWIRPLLDALDAQTLHGSPRGAFEVLLVDDGSTDGTAVLLDHWTAHRAWARVIHEPPSGWPSHPRNVGIGLARGTYVFLVDHDDWLMPDALEKMAGFADAAEADVVVGWMIGQGRKVPTTLFRATVADAHPPAQPLQGSMTTHALFRRTFLDRIGLRFDEELRRLEDHVFMARAYTEASRIAVYADSPVYVHAERDDGAGAGYRRYRPGEYYPALRRAIDTIVTALPRGAARDAYLGRWIRRELVGRLQADAIRWLPRAERDGFFASVQEVLVGHVPADADVGLSPALRWPTALARTATADEFYRAEDVMTTTVRTTVASRPGSAVLAGAVSSKTLARAVAALGSDEALPTGRAATDARRAAARRARLGLMRLVARFPGGGLHRLLVTWGRTPRLAARRAAAVAAVAAPAAAAVLVGVAAPATGAAALGLVALGLVALGLVATTWLAVRSLRGWPTALRQALALAPGVVAVVLAPAPAGAAGAGVALVAIGVAVGLDHRWRRTDVRAHAGRAGGFVARTGWIALTAAAVSALTFAANALALPLTLPLTP